MLTVLEEENMILYLKHKLPEHIMGAKGNFEKLLLK